jgi:hypothetical protein
MVIKNVLQPHVPFVIHNRGLTQRGRAATKYFEPLITADEHGLFTLYVIPVKSLP